MQKELNLVLKHKLENLINDEIGKRIIDRSLFVILGDSYSGLVELEKVVGVITGLQYHADTDKYIADFDLFTSLDLGRIALSGIDKLVLSPFGIGHKDDDNNITNYKLIGFSLTSPSE